MAAALAACRLRRATLVIAKLDRLARNVHFVSGLMESGVDFVACDNPHATPLLIHILASVAEHEATAISQRCCRCSADGSALSRRRTCSIAWTAVIAPDNPRRSATAASPDEVAYRPGMTLCPGQSTSLPVIITTDPITMPEAGRNL